MSSRAFALASLAIALGAAAPAPAPAPRPLPYLSPATAPDTLALLPPAPQPASMRGLMDRQVFRGTRSFKGTPRWELAKNDVDEATTAMLADFSCSAGGQLTEANSPKLILLLRRMRGDVANAVKAPKDYYLRQRPFLLDRGDICVERSTALNMSPDYPSGHTTWGWSLGLVLAELDPAHASQILLRAKAFGESRVICGVHNASAIEAGRMNASIVVAARHGDATFRADLDAAREEMAANVAAGGTDSAVCSHEAALIAKTPW